MWDPWESLINFHFHHLVLSLAWFCKCVNKDGHGLDLLAALEKNEPAQVVSYHDRFLKGKDCDSMWSDLNVMAAHLCHTAVPKVGILRSFREKSVNIESIMLFVDKIVHLFAGVSLVSSWIWNFGFSKYDSEDIIN